MPKTPPGNNSPEPVISGVQRFPHPEPSRKRPRIRPVFLPFAGCPRRCSFCNQHAITGTGPKPLGTILQDLKTELMADNRPMELAFFGGTFTALPAPWPERFLALARRFRDQGVITRIRCSTRPDAVGPETLALLRDYGLDLIELGIQSFHDPALTACNRGYEAHTALDACRRVREAGFNLGVQLMPGLPRQDREAFDADIRHAVALAPECARLYPCTVLRNTALALAWETGDYSPWSLDETVDVLGDALLRLWDANIHVIRTGLPPEPGLEKHILAGPTHPALGQLARAEALFRHLRRHIRKLPTQPRSLLAPQRHRSDLVGHKRSMLPRYADIGLPEAHISFHDGDFFALA